jgi:hypothetical protein
LFGVLLPLAALALQGWCAREIFDPAPTLWHSLAIGLVPAFHVLALWLDVGVLRRYHVDLLGTVGLGVAAVYTLVFAPLLPIAVIALVAGVGILPFAPLGALIASVLQLRRIRKQTRVVPVSRLQPCDTVPYRAVPERAIEQLAWYQRGWVRTLGGVALGVLLLVALEVPVWITHHGLEQATDDDPVRASEGVALLRTWGSERVLLEAANSWGSRRLTPFIERRRTSSAEASSVYYRVTGEAPSDSQYFWELAMDPRSGRGWDRYQGTRRIGAMQPDLELFASRLDGSIDSTAALGYVEWTLVFKNQSPTDAAEARARLRLPAGGVVSRATLWIDGEPREAVFGGSGQVREAYRNVVSRRRDPLLVTASGPDQVQVQCFPIPADGGEMKVRIGITFPLAVDGKSTLSALLPTLEAHNFGVATAHPVWLESKTRLSAGERVSSSAGGRQVLRVSGDPREPTAVVASRTTKRAAWTPVPGEPGSVPEVVVQRLRAVEARAPARLGLVVDTSLGMQSALESIEHALATLPKGVELRLALPDDAGFHWSRPEPVDVDELRSDLSEIEPRGGVDNVPAVVAAAHWAAQVPGGVALWLHGAQPVPLGSSERLQQYFERSSGQVIHAQVELGEHVLLGQVGSPRGLEALPRFSDLGRDLVRQFELWSGRREQWVVERRRQAQAPDLESAHRTSDHLLRLWANDQTRALASESPEEATRLAVSHRLVTPLTGAVVLESRAQYEAAGLDPDQAMEGSPSVPEPETWALLVVCALLLLWQLRLRQPRLGAA